MINMRHPVSKYLEGSLNGRALRRFERHLKECGKCHEQVEADRSIQRRLREAGGPEPRSDLAERILARSAQPAPPAKPFHRPRAGSDGTAAWMEHRGSKVRKLAALTGSATVAAVAVLGGAYVVGGGSQIREAAGGPVFASVQSASEGANGHTVMANEELSRLRAVGWNCPELSALGYDLEYAHGYQIAGHPTLKLVVSRGDSVITIYERRKTPPAQRHAEAMKSAPPINAATGRTTAEDGFTQVPLQMGDGTVETMWFRYGEKWEIAFQTQQAWYMVQSDIPVTEVAAAVSHVVATDRAQLAQPVDVEKSGLFDRVWQGLTAFDR